MPRRFRLGVLNLTEVNILKQPYPLNYTTPYSLAIGCSVGLFIFLFTYIIEPFNFTDRIAYSTLSVSIGYGLITFVICIVSLLLLPKFFPKYFTEERWTVGKEILWISILLVMIGLSNYFYHRLISIPSIANGSQLKLLAISVGNTLVIGFIPTVIIVLINQIRLIRKHSANEFSGVDRLRKELEQSTSIVLEGENKTDHISIQPEQFFFAEANGNYVEIYFLEENAIKKKLLRSTLTKMEEAVNDHSQLQRVHRKYIANLTLADKITGNAQGYKLHYEIADRIVPVSRQRSELLF